MRRKIRAVLTIVIFAGGVILGVKAGDIFPHIGSHQNTTNTYVVQAVQTENQVVLLSLGIQGIITREADGDFFGVTIPGASKSTFLQYSYRAKLGFEGKDVTITPVDNTHVQVEVPKFTFIGHSDEAFQTIAENNGILSFITPDIDAAEMITHVLSPQEMHGQVEANKDLLKEQATQHYTSLIQAIDPSLNVDVVFADE